MISLASRSRESEERIDLPVEQSPLRLRRTRAVFHSTHLDAYLFPNPGLVQHLPDRQMGIGAKISANLNRLVIGHGMPPEFSLKERSLFQSFIEKLEHRFRISKTDQ